MTRSLDNSGIVARRLTLAGVLEREIDLYKNKTPRSNELQKKAAHYLPGGSSRDTAYFDPYPLFVEYGRGHSICDVDGNCYLDFMLNAGSLILGHSHPLIVQSLQAAAGNGCSFGVPSESQIRLAKLLCERTPSIERVRFTNSGTEATGCALRLARAFTGRHQIAKFEGIYHGSHEYASVSVKPPSGKLDPRGPTAIPEFPGMPPSILNDVIVLPFNDLEQSLGLIRKHKDQLACVIMEAIASNFGYVSCHPGFLEAIRDVTKELGILLILDEVQSFRAARGGAQELFGVTPDMTTFGKLIGGGLPVGAFGGREDIMALHDPSRGVPPVVAHAGTFNANPMTTLAGEVTLNQLTPDAYLKLNRLGDLLRRRLLAIFHQNRIPAQVTGAASFFGIHFTSQEVTDYRSALTGDLEMRRCLFMGLINEGILLQTNCSGALTIMSTETEIETLIAAISRVISRMRDSLPRVSLDN
jgi:glutamate-1-semialdehyde 2,1-aminomutase